MPGDLPPRFRDTTLHVLTLAAGGGLLLFGLAYVRLLDRLVDAGLVVGLTGVFLVIAVIGVRMLAAQHPQLDPRRPSSAPIRGLVDELAAATGSPRPGITMDDSTQGRALPNVGAIEMGHGTETLVFTEQMIADLESGRLAFPLLRGVVLHELGHLAYDHSLLRLWLGVGERLVRVAAILAVIALMLDPGALRLVLHEPLLAFAIATGPLTVSIVVGMIARAQEVQADAFAVRHAAGRELTGFFRWMQAELGPLLAFQRDGVPRDPAARAELRAGLAHLADEAQREGDQERLAFFADLVRQLDRRAAADGPRPSAPRRRLAMLERWLGATLRAWVGAIRLTRSHPDVGDRLRRVAAEMGSTASPTG